MAKLAPIRPEPQKTGGRNVAHPSDRALLELLVVKIDALAAAVDELARLPSAPALIAALEEEFACGSFTAGGLLLIADAERDNPVAKAISELIDMTAPPRARATQLGLLLSRLPQIEIRSRSRGFAVYGLRT